MSTDRTALRLRAAVGVLMATSVLMAGPGGIALAAPGTNNGDNGNHGQGNNGRGNGGTPGGDPGSEPGGGPGTGGGGIGGPNTDPDPQPPTDPAAPAGFGGNTAAGVWCALVDDPELPCPEDVAGS